MILIMAANTSFADFPRLGVLLANDGFLPKQLTYKGSRLVFSRGIMALALIASLLIVVFKAALPRSSRFMRSVSSSPSRFRRPVWPAARGGSDI